MANTLRMEGKGFFIDCVNKLFIFITAGTAFAKLIDLLPSLAIILSMIVTIVVTIVNVKNKKKIRHNADLEANNLILENKKIQLDIKINELICRKEKEEREKRKSNKSK